MLTTLLIRALIVLIVFMLWRLQRAVNRLEKRFDRQFPEPVPSVLDYVPGSRQKHMPSEGLGFPNELLGLFIAFLLCVLPAIAAAAEPVQMMHLSDGTRDGYVNYDGSCVQCSIGMVGCNCNDLNAALVLFDSDFGPAERGGSNPSRVEAYCRRRGIVAWSVTGRTVDDTMPWMIWACKTGRFAAVGAGTQHFQTLYGYDPNTKEFLLCNNQTPRRIDRYSEADFRKLHAASGPWCVILEKPSSPPPNYGDLLD